MKTILILFLPSVIFQLMRIVVTEDPGPNTDMGLVLFQVGALIILFNIFRNIYRILFVGSKDEA